MREEAFVVEVYAARESSDIYIEKPESPLTVTSLASACLENYNKNVFL